MFNKFKAFKSPDVASDFNRSPKELWSIGGWLNGLDITYSASDGHSSNPHLDMQPGAFVHDGIVVISDSLVSEDISGTATPADPLVFYAVSNGENELSDPTFHFTPRSSVPAGAADIAESTDGTTWTKVQGVSIFEILNKIDSLHNHTITRTAGETITQGENLYLDSANEAFIAEPDGTASSNVVGVALNSASTGDDVDILTLGTFEDASLSFASAGLIIYLDAGGAFTDSAPATPSIAIPVGISTDVDELIYIPEKTPLALDAFVSSLDLINGVSIEWKDSNTVNVGAGTLVFNGRSFANSSVTPIVIGSNMDSAEDPTLGTAGSDSELRDTWYYIYAIPSGSGFSAVFSTAPPNLNRRSARILSLLRKSGQKSVSGTMSVSIDGATAETYTPSTTPMSSSEFVDDINDSANWGTKPPIRAFVVGGASVGEYGIGLQANGSSGEASTIEITSSSLQWDSSTLFTIGQEFGGQNWKYLGVAKNSSSLDIIKFNIDYTDGFYQFLEGADRENAPGDTHFRASTASKLFVTTISQDMNNSPYYQDIDFSSFVPVHSKKARLLLSGASGSPGGGHAVAFRSTGSGSVNWDILIGQRNNTADGANMTDYVDVVVSGLQKGQAAKRDNNVNVLVSGFFDKR